MKKGDVVVVAADDDDDEVRTVPDRRTRLVNVVFVGKNKYSVCYMLVTGEGGEGKCKGRGGKWH
jgi:hypothetical protein